MKKCLITILSLILLVSILTSCAAGPSEEELRKRFEGYTPDKNAVAVLDYSTFYFADHELNLNNIAEGEDLEIGFVLADGKVYFATSKQNGLFGDYSLYVYSCDFYGNNKQVVFEKHGYKTGFGVRANQGKFYFSHHTTNGFDASSQVIDSYDVVTGVYQTEATGKDANLSDYQKKACGSYSCTYEGDVLRVVDEAKNTTYTIAPESLFGGTFSKELEGLKWEYSGFYATDNGKMFLLYSVNTNWPPYPHILCEYIPESNEIVFSLLYFAHDIIGFRIEYLQ